MKIKRRNQSSGTIVAIGTLVISLSGCSWGNFQSIHRPLDTASGKGALVDIKQRAIVVGERSVKGSANPGMEQGSITVVCAEPSPDAMAAYAAELAAKTGKVEVGAGMQEGAAFTGLRTTSIQLLRDQLFNTCLAYMNQGLDAGEYDLAVRRNQKATVALMSIEQLSGAVRAPAATISTAGSAEAARHITEISTQIKNTDEALIRAKEELSAVENSESDAHKALTEEVARLTENKAALQKALEQNRAVLASGSAVATISTAGIPQARSEESIKNVAQAIKEIAMEFISTDDTPQLCLKHYDEISAGGGREGVSAMQEFCQKFYDGPDRIAANMLENQKALLALMEKENSSQAEIEALKRQLNILQSAIDSTKAQSISPPWR